MKLLIEAVENGYILTYKDDDGKTNKFIETSDQGMLQAVHSILGDLGSRYDDERIYIIKAPGDKNDKFTEEHARIIWPSEVDECCTT